MRRAPLIISLLVILTATLAYAHFCNNIYKTPDRIIVKPEKPITTLQTTDQMRVFVKNNYPTFLQNIRLVAQSSDDKLICTITPDALPRLKPAEKGSFHVAIDARNVRTGNYKLTFGISADNVGFQPMEQASIEDVKGWVNQGNASSKVLTAETLAARQDPLGRQILAEYLAGKYGRQYQVRGIRCVGKAAQKANLDLLTPLLDNRDGLIKGNAILAMGMLGADQNQIMGYAQTQDPFVYTCCAAAVAMCGSTDATVLTALNYGLSSDNAWLQIAGAWGLGCYRERQPEAARLLDAAFDNNRDAELRVFAGDALTWLAARNGGGTGE
jgi:hypothetical protein